MDSKLKDSANESEEEDNLKETLNEKIDRFALENSEDDEDFDVSDQVSHFCLTSDTHFLIRYRIKFIERRFKRRFTFYNQFVDLKKNSVT